MQDRFKIARACAVGAALFVAVALFVMPTFWWLGLLAGIAAGYLSGYLAYAPKVVTSAVPVAFGEVTGGFVSFLGTLGGAANALGRWCLRPHPYLFLPLLISPFATWRIVERFRYKPYAQFDHNDWSCFVFVVAFSMVVLHLAIVVITIIGDENPARAGRTSGPRNTYSEFLTDLGRGTFVTGRFLFWSVWKSLAIGIYRLFRLIHSVRRVQCGFYSVIGGLITLWILLTWGPSLETLSSNLLAYSIAVAFGAVIGAAVGVSSWEIISTRVLGVKAE